MKQSIFLLATLVIFAACTGGNQKNKNTEKNTADTTLAEVITEKPVEIAYTQCPLAYLVNGELYFHSFDENKKVKFAEEPDAIFNFTFDPEGNIMYYSVERDSMLWLKSVDLSKAVITPEWIINWELTKKTCTTETYNETSPLFLYNGKLIIRHNFKWDYYNFISMAIYSIANKNITQKGYDYSFIKKLSGTLSSNKAEQYFQIIDQHLFYTRNSIKVCLTDKLDFEILKTKGSEDYWVETDFTYYTLSPDETKVLFGSVVEMGDLAHGPYCIANADGTNQIILKATDVGSSKSPIWLKNNSVAFIDYENNLFIASNDENSIQKIAENVSSYVAR
ncbi:MAG: hypothetical protein PHW19_11605 [Salinivirgaceae bacterium]|nr:hypothetical protein [Salinivirgaceae bacterium]